MLRLVTDRQTNGRTDGIGLAVGVKGLNKLSGKHAISLCVSILVNLFTN